VGSGTRRPARHTEPNADLARSVPNVAGTGDGDRLGHVCGNGGQQGEEQAHQQIDENLKRVYEEALSEDIPDRFKELIARLRAKEDGR
jgi:hypothetical protein